MTDLLLTDVEAGRALPELAYEVTATTVVLGALAARDWPALRRQAHSLKGALATLGDEAGSTRARARRPRSRSRSRCAGLPGGMVAPGRPSRSPGGRCLARPFRRVSPMPGRRGSLARLPNWAT